MSINVKNILSHEIAFVFYVIFLYKITYYYLIGALFHFGWNIYLFDFYVEGFEGIYHNFSFFLASFNNLLVTIPLLVIYAFVYKFKEKFTWNEISTHQLYKPTKYFLIFVVAFTTWFYSFSAYNYFFDRLFLFDRLLLVFCFILLFRTPKILPLFILLTVLWVTQFSHPLGNNSITDKKIIYEMMIVFLSFISINSFKKINLNYLWVIIFALIGTNYFIPGLHKIIISPHFYEWVTENRLGLLVLNANSRDWLKFFSDESIYSLIKFINEYNFIFTLSGLILEMSGILLLFKRKITLFLIPSYILFHFLVFALTGIFFWKWILFNSFILGLIIFYKREFLDLFKKKYYLVSIMLILLSPVLFNPVWLGWWDIRVNNTFKYYVSNENMIKQLSGNSFEPYNQTFTFSWNLRNILSKDKNYYRLYLDDYNTMKYFEKDKSIIQSELKNKFLEFSDSLFRIKVEKFVIKYLNNKYNRKNPEYHKILKVPNHLWLTKYPNNKYEGDFEIDKFYLMHKMYYINKNNQLEKLINDTILKVNIK